MNPKTFRRIAKSLIPCPQQRGRIDKDRRYQLCVGQADAEVVQTPSLDHSPHFAQLRHSHVG